ncbi:hypothetical protein [Bacillus thuringiensis]|uniref:hypothetical protein n=1 Tax=Bacillus thuringiensis TaxID=1428 RepID=UPI0008FD615B|nr:hypothetical protein [Bacillus thuringiensis]
MDWDFYFYVGNTLLVSMNDFLKITPAHFSKQFIMHLRYNNPDALHEQKTKQIYTLDQTPFL